MPGNTNLVIANWKMNLSSASGAELVSRLAPLAAGLSRSQIWIAPPFTIIPALAPLVKGSGMQLGAQNVHGEPYGPFTGEVSAAMLKEFGVSFALAGHSERRHVFGETDELVAQRVSAAKHADLKIVLCLGETLKERESNLTAEVLKRQLSAVLQTTSAHEHKAIILAYEPVWAIGTGKVATTAEINGAHQHIISCWTELSSLPCPPIVYGGSVSPENFEGILALPLVAGALVGGASLSFEKFSTLVSIGERF